LWGSSGCKSFTPWENNAIDSLEEGGWG
jgi:hypothetical protein